MRAGSPSASARLVGAERDKLPPAGRSLPAAQRTIWPQNWSSKVLPVHLPETPRLIARQVKHLPQAIPRGGEQRLFGAGAASGSASGASGVAAGSASAMDQRTLAAGLAWVCSLCQYHAGSAAQRSALASGSAENCAKTDAAPSGATAGLKPLRRWAITKPGSTELPSCTGSASASGVPRYAAGMLRGPAITTSAVPRSFTASTRFFCPCSPAHRAGRPRGSPGQTPAIPLSSPAAAAPPAACSVETP